VNPARSCMAVGVDDHPLKTLGNMIHFPRIGAGSGLLLHEHEGRIWNLRPRKAQMDCCCSASHRRPVSVAPRTPSNDSSVIIACSAAPARCSVAVIVASHSPSAVSTSMASFYVLGAADPCPNGHRGPSCGRDDFVALITDPLSRRFEAYLFSGLFSLATHRAAPRSPVNAGQDSYRAIAVTARPTYRLPAPASCQSEARLIGGERYTRSVSMPAT
jgi:hypothetical protein